MLAALLGLAVLAGGVAQAQEYPVRPVKIVVPSAPGASIDTLARIIAARLGEPLGQAIVVENRAGASGVLGIGGHQAGVVRFTSDLAVRCGVYDNIAPPVGRGRVR